MNEKNLCRKLVFKGGLNLYTPPDPYLIYQRLAEIYLRGKDAKVVLTASVKCKPYRLQDDFEHYTWVASHVRERLEPVHFVKWVKQEIPKEFWRFNLYIDQNKQLLLKSARESNIDEVWVSMKDKDNSLKSVHLNNRILQDINLGKKYLPTYEEIAKTVVNWGDYQYKFGKVAEPTVQWR